MPKATAEAEHEVELHEVSKALPQVANDQQFFSF